MIQTASMMGLSVLFGEERPDFISENMMLADVFERTAARIPHKLAIVYGETCLTYAELDSNAERLAARLRRTCGAGPGTVICLFMKRGVDLLVSQLAVAKTGSAWLGLEFDCTPVARVVECVVDSKAVACLCSQPFDMLCVERNASADLKELLDLERWLVVNGNETFGELPEIAMREIRHDLTGAQTNDQLPSYMIYTSGSTGKPKGIVISQRAIVNFLSSENEVLGIREDDLVAQHFSVAFDMSFEEIWISYLVGATLWIVPKHLTVDPEGFCNALICANVTVLSVVPTLLSLFPRDVPSIRILNLGGEACPSSLVDRFASSSRQMFNTYGPSEATVSATLERLQVGTAVTIGKPLPNYNVCIIDNETNTILPLGAQGELCIFGVGLAVGYHGRPDLTEAKFITNVKQLSGVRVYKTGDLAQITEDSRIKCLGRVDDQVKIRGYRVELGEIENVLANHSQVGAAAVLLQKIDGIDQLIAYFVPSSPSEIPSVKMLRAHLASFLPTYMIPTHYVGLHIMPRLTSGKVDRHGLRARNFQADFEMPKDVENSNGQDPFSCEDVEPIFVTPTLTTSALLVELLRKMFPNQEIGRTDDIFDDLGAHSLFVSELVSTLRQHASLSSLSVLNIFQARRVDKIKELLDELVLAHSAEQANESSNSDSHQAVSSSLNTPNTWRFFGRKITCGIAQLICVPFIFLIRVSMWLAPYYVYRRDNDTITAIGLAVFAFIVANLAIFVVVILLNRILLLGASDGVYSLYGLFYFRVWFAERLREVVPVRLVVGTPWFNLYLRALGCDVGLDCHFNLFLFRIPNLMRFGKDCSVGQHVIIDNCTVDSSFNFHVGTVIIEDNVVIGSNTVVGHGVTLEASSEVEALSTVLPKTVIPQESVFGGSPGRFIRDRSVKSEQRNDRASFGRRAFEMLFYLCAATMVSVLFLFLVFPAIIAVDSIARLWGRTDFWSIQLVFEFFALALPASAILTFAAFCVTAFLCRILIPKIEPGRHSFSGSAYYRKWTLSLIQSHATDLLFGLFASVYAQFWYRALGVRVGQRTELSTGTCNVPNLIEFKAESFSADQVTIGDDDTRGNGFTIDKVTIGMRTFLGNSSYVADGTNLPNDVLIGVLSRAPPNEQLKPGQTWVGSPPILIPRRAIDGQRFPRHLTFTPSYARLFARATIELIRIILPTAIVVAAAYNILLLVDDLKTPGTLVLGLLAFGTGYAILCYVFVLVLKWLVIGIYRPAEYPMWTLQVWLSEMITSLFNELAVNNFLYAFRGTPYLPTLLWLFGLRVG